MTATPQRPEGARPDWYADPVQAGVLRYWDGATWTPHTAPAPSGRPEPNGSRRTAWWQTWWAIVPGLLLCLPAGLIGLWFRPGASLRLRSTATVLAVGLIAALALTGQTSPTQEGVAAPPAPSVAPEAVAAAETDATDPQASESAPVVDEPDVTSAPAPEVIAPPDSVMPAVAGMHRRDAEAALVAAGIGIRELRQVPSPEPKGTVLRQAREAGSTMAPGSSIVLIVASPYPRVPSVVGRSKAVAVARLEGAGFQVSVTEEARTSGKDGVVLEQGATGRLKSGSRVAIVVSSLVRPVAPAPSNCTGGYDPCLPPASDYDCAGGSGDGPEYASGPIYISGSDPYDLDRDGDGVACE